MGYIALSTEYICNAVIKILSRNVIHLPVKEALVIAAGFRSSRTLVLVSTRGIEGVLDSTRMGRSFQFCLIILQIYAE